ncbi:MAG TPA: adenylate/guanylate cyclase domain-containing protein [Phenylobacterium sp.]|uniref:adenylate/guanylate cyclase domain-containing protein n=1 Tax=Phenylobacterium sp. TaxID=1871053 RepID=UPI002CFF871E|nr:adenylate/guanylate cyclase domain-containing protein [Phenylobacterium sp.]HXA38154.1 adenylate/guanylate cyclase domain-containing protein [Phenylobacterium sp.]
MNARAPFIVAEQAERRVPDSGRALFWRLMWIYHLASFVAVLVTLLLALLGLEFTGLQWMMFWIAVAPTVAFYTSLDVMVIRRQLAPLAPVLSALDRGEQPDLEAKGAALVRALNLPQFSAMRVICLHGPAATAALVFVIFVVNTIFHAGVATWQLVSFAALVLFFATPTHAIFEYFAVSRAMEPIAARLSRTLEGPLSADQQGRLISVPLRNKLLFLTIFVCALPLVFFAASFLFKFSRLMSKHGFVAPPGDIVSLYVWTLGVVATCALGAILMAILTSQEVSRSAARLIEAMRQVESGHLDGVELDVLSTDEYADINRGFGLMLDSLRQEQQILEVTQDLAGELLLEVLIARIMTATTQLLNAERATLFLYDEKTDELFTLYADGMERRQIRVPTASGIAGAVFTSGRMENITDPYADPRFNSDIDLRTGFRTRSILCVPVTNKAGARIGVAQALNKRDGAFVARDEARLKAFAAQVAVSLENAKLFDDVLSMKNYNESILKSTSNGIVTLDADGRIVTANDAAQTLIGRPREAMIERRAQELFHGSNAWIADSLAKTQATGETALAIDAELARPEGGAASVNMTAMPLIDATEAQIGSMLVLEDITEEKRVRSTMSRYMSKEVADQLLSAGELELGGMEQKVTVMFSDVRSFTSIAEALGPRQTVSLLNEYFTEMVDVIFQHGGILDKYMGDGIMALYGAPLVGANDADNALAAADEMMRRLAQLNVRRVAAGQAALDIGIGFSTGPTVVGNIGSVRRLDYTVIGDTVNLASRLEGATKQYSARILLSEMTVRDLKKPATLREIDLIRVKGKDRPVAVYESLGYRAAEPGVEGLLELHAAGVAAYRARDWRKARRAFDSALELYPADGPATVYRQRCDLLATTPPDEAWDGVWNLTEK